MILTFSIFVYSVYKIYANHISMNYFMFCAFILILL